MVFGVRFSAGRDTGLGGYMREIRDIGSCKAAVKQLRLFLKHMRHCDASLRYAHHFCFSSTRHPARLLCCLQVPQVNDITVERGSSRVGSALSASPSYYCLPSENTVPLCQTRALPALHIPSRCCKSDGYTYTEPLQSPSQHTRSFVAGSSVSAWTRRSSHTVYSCW